MSELIFKTFIKNHNDTANEKVREKYGVLGSLSGIVFNIFLTIIKMIAGFITGSVSVTADAINNLSDALSSVITLIGFKMSGKPADRQHPFGHGRIEYISALFVAIAILFMGVELVRTSFDKILHAEAIIFSPISVIILIISILVKLYMYFFNRSIAKKIDSQSMLAAAKDSLSDSVATLAVLVGIIVFYYTQISIDGYIGLIVAGFILFCGYQTIRDSLSPLLGQLPSTELVDEIKQTVLLHDGIIGMHDLIIHNYGPTRFMISLHAEVSAKDDVIKLHDTIDLIEKELKTKLGCDAVIHLDPVEADNEAIAEKRIGVTKILHSIDKNLTLHDFRMVTGPTHTNLIFDVVVPFGYEMSDEELTSRISKEVSKKYENHFIVIEIDKDYV